MNKNFIKKLKAVTMHMQSYTNKEIAIKLDVSEKTMCQWLKDIQGIDYVTQLINLHRRFSELVSNKNACIKDIHSLRNVIKSIENRLKT